MKKGAGPALAIIVLLAFALEAIVLTNFIVQTQFLRRTIRETEILRAINTLELTKKSLEQAFKYSVNQVLAEAEKSDYSSAEIQSRVTQRFNDYCEKLKTKNIMIPTYTVSMKEDGDSTSFTTTSIGYLTYESDFFEINSKVSFSYTKAAGAQSVPSTQSPTTPTCECKETIIGTSKCTADCPKAGQVCPNGIQDCI